MRKIKILLWMAICCLLLTNVAVVHAQTTDSFTSDESYITRPLLDLYKSNVLQFEEGNGKVTFVEKSDGILVEGSAAAVTSGTFKISKTFNFDGNRVGRLSLDALAGKGEDLTVRFYLDNSRESFASITVPQQGREDLWTRDIALQADVLSENIRGEHTVSFSVEAAEGTDKVAILLRSVEFVENSIPTVYMNLDESLGTVADMNNSDTKVDECYGSMQIEIPAGYTYEYGENAGKTATEDISTEYKLSYLRGRGNSTWMTDKKPYKIKLEKNASLIGMANDKHWALIANRYDCSKLRNKMTYWMGDQIGLEYSPDLVPVDVVMNGIYFGSYYLSETVRTDESRLNIDSLSGDETSTDSSAISGGYLLNFHAWGDSDTVKYFTTSHGLALTYNSPSYEDADNTAQMNYIKEYCQKTEDALFGDNFKDSKGVSYTEYMDLDSAVDFYLLQEMSANGDSYETGSTYLYKKKDGKLYWGPIWDFDAVAYNCNFAFDDPTGLVIVDKLDGDTTKWIERLLEDPAFKKRIAERWPVLREKYLEYCEDGGVMDQYFDQYLKVSLRYDEEKWGLLILNNTDSDVVTSYLKSSYDEKERLKKWILARVNWYDSNIAEQYKSENYKITFMADGKKVTVLDAYSGYSIGSLPTAPAKSGYIFEGWMICDNAGQETGTYADASTVFKGNATLKAVYISGKNLIVPTSLYLSTSVINYQYMTSDPDSDIMSENIFTLYSSVYPKGAYGTVKYASTDSNVATVDQKGKVTIVGMGDAKIIVSCGALQKICKVHACEEGAEDDTPTLSASKLSMTIGQRKQLTLKYTEEYPVTVTYDWSSLNDSVASVDQCGVITAKKAGTTRIILSDNDGMITSCTVTVYKASSIKKGYTCTYKGLKYKVTSKAISGGTVTVLGPTGKKIRSVNIRSTLTIKGETFKVTGISYKAFYKCKKLRKVYLGKNLKSIGRKAFTGINKHARFRVPASKKKAYKKLLTSSRGFKKKTMKIYQ